MQQIAESLRAIQQLMSLPAAADIDKRLTLAIQALSTYGWYINDRWSFQDIFSGYEYCLSGDSAALDEHVSFIIQQDLDKSEETLCERHSHRAQPLRSAFNAHYAGNFDCSIPVFFAQCDGICKEKSSYSFFGNDKINGVYVPKVAKWVNDGNKCSIQRAMCAAFLEKGAFQLHCAQPNKIDITRHSVLHGESNEYGTKINSLKTISLLLYVSDMMNW
jgi:hypothetical protein